MPMHIIVRLFASHREAAGAGSVAVQLAPGATAADAYGRARDIHAGLPASTDGVAFAVNREFAKPETQLAEGDEVAVLPPVAGG
jgi:molybdopterin converting factor small subunit